MVEIIPAILPKNSREIEKKVQGLLNYVDVVQIDFVDGKFAKVLTWPYNGEDEYFIEALEKEEQGMPFWEEINYELDLMVKNAHENLDYFYKFGPSRLVLHAEAEGDEETFANFVEAIDPYLRDTMEIGIAFNIDSSVKDYAHILKEVDFVQCMGIADIGHQGEPFDERVLGKIKEIGDAYPGLPIAVDGGVNLLNAPLLIEAGATRLVVGSAIWGSKNPIGALQEFLELAENSNQ